MLQVSYNSYLRIVRKQLFWNILEGATSLGYSAEVSGLGRAGKQVFGNVCQSGIVFKAGGKIRDGGRTRWVSSADRVMAFYSVLVL